MNLSKLFLNTYLNSTFVRIKNSLMDSKLTLKLDESVIEKAKSYAKKKNTSLSKLIESYLGLLIEPKEDQKITPLVKSLSGAVKLPKNYDYKKEIKKHLLNKYSN